MIEMMELYRQAAPFYDADYASIHYEGDIAFYVDLARETGGPVLEMGCGTGRVLLPAARAGLEIHGLDLSPDMLDVLRARLASEPPEVQARVSVSAGDIRTAGVGRQFRLITAPFRVAQVLVKREDQRAWLRNVRRHLAPGGALCFDVFQPNFSYLVEPRGPVTDLDRTDPETGVRVRRFSRLVPHNPAQYFELHLQWIVEDRNGGRISEPSARCDLRWFTRGELENLLELEGFRIREYWGTFKRDPFGENATDQVILATL